MYTIEMNSARKDAPVVNANIKSNSPVVEVFSAMVKGDSLDKFGNAGNKSVEYIKELNNRAANGDQMAMSELNQIRRFVIEPLVIEEAKVLQIFGGYQNVGFDETIEREVYDYVGGGARFQALNGDVPFGAPVRNRYPVATTVVSGGFVVDYRRAANGDMTLENRGMEMVRADIMNKAAAYVMDVIYKGIKGATGVKYFAEGAGIQRSDLDAVIKNVRRLGPVSLVGGYGVVSQINNFANWTNGTITGIADDAMEEIRKAGLLSVYNGAIIREVPVALDYQKIENGNFKPILPEGLLFVLPQGLRAPVATWTRGGLTSLTGVDVASGHHMTRFDLEIAADVAKGHEFEIGLINDTNL